MSARTRRRAKHDQAANVAGHAVTEALVFTGGRYRPLQDSDIALITNSAFDILENIGMADAPAWLRDMLIEHGAHVRDDGRVSFDRSLIETAISRAPNKIQLPGFQAHRGLEIGGGKVHIGTGGAAVQVLDATNCEYRDSTLQDLYVMMRVLDHCPNIHYGLRPLVARDMPSSYDLDINTAYACLKGTGKPIGISFDNTTHVAPIIDLFNTALGHEDGFRRQPFCMAVIAHVVPPLRFAEEGVDIMRTAIDHGMPLQIVSAGQAGATSPASLAGALAQGMAECLAGMMVVDAIKPGHPCIYAFMPFISDLRTGAMSGGGGESAIANAAAAQLLLELGLPSTVSAGMTDSKIVDAQAGYEKAYSVALAAQAGADMINLSVGMLGSIMVASPEAMVVDDEMCGAILRTVRGIDVSAEMIDLDSMERVVTGEGHYLGEAQTLKLMKTEYIYPHLGDRQSVDDWIEAGRVTVWNRACDQVLSILETHPEHLDPKVDQVIRDKFDIKLP